MADKIDDELLEESYTEFPGYKLGGGTDAGKLATFFSKFFARRRTRADIKGRLAGDTIKNADTFEGTPGMGLVKGLPKLPQVEYERKRRYKEYEDMDEYPEIGAALDIYSDDGTQKHIQGQIFEIETDHE